ncbi:2084_t:CDS:1 [Funneliformis geosporum]|uniref:Transcription initiation factor IIB n=1 Tax=Funneliformis geosporum TaxID=1117311 RepID=A0A9W4WLV7_9GLOM|nr:2104_t:CDS:1 [Funneliformis geosporum]CAI2176320.1 2084_t:CDS:1 [Funneliformis geosporum]
MLRTPFPKIKPLVDDDSALKVFRPDLNIRLICPECRNPQPNLIEEYSSGDVVCGDCGLVLADRIIDTRSEWRTFSGDDNGSLDPSRVGAAADPLLKDSALDTIISSNGHKGLNRTHYKVTTSKFDMTLKHAYSEIEALCGSMDLTKEISDTTKQLYRRTIEEKLLRGKNQMAIFSACIYIACRVKKVARSFREICLSSQVSKREIARCFKILYNNLELNVGQMTAEDLMIRFSQSLNLSRDLQIIATRLSKRTNDLGLLSGRNQNTVAAACIHYASEISHGGIPIDNLAKVSGMATSSIKSVYRLLHAERERFQDIIDNKEKIVLTK